MQRHLLYRLLALCIPVAFGMTGVAARAAGLEGASQPMAAPDAAGGPASAPVVEDPGAAAAAADPFGDAKPVGEAELKHERGGFVTAAGVTFDFGATVQTSINGTLALVSTINLSPAGKVVQTTWVNPALPNATVITPGDANALSSITGLDLHGLSGASGAVVKDSQGGFTALLANVTPSLLQNLVINTANMQKITQNTNITLTLPAFDATQAQFGRSALFLQLAGALNFGQLSMVGH